MTKECDLQEDKNWKVQAYYSIGDQYNEDWRKPKECLPNDEYKKAKEEKYRQQCRRFDQKEQPTPEKKNEFEPMLARFTAASEKRHDETDVVLQNQQALIHIIEQQTSQLSRQFNERLP